MSLFKRYQLTFWGSVPRRLREKGIEEGKKLGGVVLGK